jgi:hypothetical protein
VRSRLARAAVPILAAAIVLPVAAWLDANVVRRLQQEAGALFDPDRLLLGLSLGYLVVAGAVVVLALVV